MDIYREANELFPYIEGTFLDKPYTLTMANIYTDDFPDHKGDLVKKYILRFKESKKALILNKVNTKIIIGVYGRETDDWEGKPITLYAEEVKAFGKLHQAVRVKAPPSNGNGSRPASQDAPAMPEAQAVAPAEAELAEFFPRPEETSHYTNE